ncbi:hypothetical protein IVB27_10790 [Bradyrhizobium sp. 197]|uniref:hypothetical protein n=1 Tax=Bradyrhizobium sp. 197 TaxID=2782663 RepID=UPI001FF956DB|nr:hypothetical protein [Bradyrhizobium sp. 197]MCK1475273.1 hypothetical protein [Bradyrhizobium sp. 197]
MVRPTRSIVVTGFPISAAHPQMQSAEKEISCSPFCRQEAFCIPQGTMAVTNALAIPKVAGRGQRLCENCWTLMRVSSATSGTRSPAPESGVFSGIFAVQLHAKVRRYDARRGGRSASSEGRPVAVENLPHCGLLAR